jgi:uncharacterized membrane protein YeaQ/YmgE (transglycosylase-associated protein family)
MEKLLVFLGLSVGGWAGWAVGARFGFFAAFLLCIVGTALGLYLGRRIARDYF